MKALADSELPGRSKAPCSFCQTAVRDNHFHPERKQCLCAVLRLHKSVFFFSLAGLVPHETSYSRKSRPSPRVRLDLIAEAYI